MPNLLLTGLSLVLCLIFAELIIRFLPFSDAIGWNRIPSLEKRTKDFEQKKGARVVCLGDSFLAWRAGESVNMVERLQKAMSDSAVLNLSEPGTDLDRYIINYNHNVSFQPDLCILFLYLGNDVRHYRPFAEIDRQYPPRESVRQIDFFKRHSALMNVTFRFLKIHFPGMRSQVFEGNLQVLQNDGGLTRELIQKRMSQIDPEILELAKSDSVNPWIVSAGVAHPGFYKDLLGLRSADSAGKIDDTLSLIRNFRLKHGTGRFIVVLIPESLQVSTAYDGFFKKCGFDLENFPIHDRRILNEKLVSGLEESGIEVLDLTQALEARPDAYLKYDIHLNAAGHEAVANRVLDYLQPAAGSRAAG